jgi:hypothetical protein
MVFQQKIHKKIYEKHECKKNINSQINENYFLWNIFGQNNNCRFFIIYFYLYNIVLHDNKHINYY